MSRSELFSGLGETIAAQGSPRFPALLAAFLRGVATYNYTVVFGYRGDVPPFDLFDDFPGGKREIFVTDYQEGPYLLDPFFLAATEPVADGLYRMRDLAPDRFYQGEYFRNYYVQTGLAEEIGYFTGVGDEAVVVLSLMRAERPFSAREFGTLQELQPIVAALVRGHWSDLASRFASGPPARGERIETRIEQSFQSFGAGLLTPRERQVVEYTLRGHSAEAVGRALGISPGTVRIHRRNIYTKLQINSQGELFSRFIGTLGKF